MIKVIILLTLIFQSEGVVSQAPEAQDSVAILLSAETKDSALIVKLNDIAFGYLKSNPRKARDLALQVSKIALQINFPEGYSRSLNVVGSSYWVTGDYQPALKYYQLSARESEAVNDLNGLSAAYHNMGEVYKKVGNYKKSIEYLEHSLAFDSSNDANYGLTLFNIGEVHLFLGDYAKAQDYFDKALEQATPRNDLRTIAYVYQNTGKIRFLTQDVTGALPLFEKATQLWKEQGDIRSLIQVYQDYSNAYLALNLIDKADSYIQQSIELAEQIEAVDLQVLNFEIESKIYKRKGDFRKSLEILEEHNALIDSVYNLKKSEQIALLQASFESETRDTENRQLRADQLIKDDRIRSQQWLIIGISLITVIAGLMAWVSFRQHRRLLEVNAILSTKSAEIENQKKEIEFQANALRLLNSELSDLNKSLETRIESRTSQLQTQNNKLAEFAFMNAHQLRAPIARAIGLINLIKKVELPEDDQVIIQYLENCGKELDTITKDISKSLGEDSIFSEHNDG